MAATTAKPPATSQADSSMSSPKNQNSTAATKETTDNAQTQPEQDSKKTEASAAAASKTEGGSDEKSTTNAPLAPPPKPSQNTQETPDYFGSGSHFSLEPNPFEQSFGGSGETPGKFGALPSVASLTSPAPLGTSGTPGWQNSLRSGPLSPAMLSGPAGGSTGYFDESYRGSFPTPNESSLRTGLTPGGGGSMFPAPSPNSQAIFNSLQSGGATPGTLDFQRAAMSAAARSKMDRDPAQTTGPNGQGINKQDYQPAQQSGAQQDPFANHSETDAVNSLYMLAQTGNRSATNQFAQSGTTAQGQQSQSQDTSPTSARGQKQSAGASSNNMSESGDYDGSDASQDVKPTTRSKGKKANAPKAAQNGKKKADETPNNKPLPTKKAKAASLEMDMELDMDMDDGDDDGKDDGGDGGSGNKKMTDEEKRKNFLERNRIAALKCRQRKKQWLANLQTKVEIFTAENDQLNAQNQQMREEIVNLKTLLLAHKDCPISHQQGLGGNAMAQVIGDFNNPHSNPYGIGMPNNQMLSMQQGQGMQRR